MTREVPFVDEVGVSEVVARVAYRLIARDFRQNPARYADPVEGMRLLADELASWNHVLVTSLYAAAMHVEDERGSLIHWRDLIVYRSRWYLVAKLAGKPWAKVPGPRVTNRGATSPEARSLEAAANNLIRRAKKEGGSYDR